MSVGPQQRRARQILMAGPGGSAVGGMPAAAAAIVQGFANAETQFGGSPAGFDVRLQDSGGGRGGRGYLRFPVALGVVLAGRYDLLHLHVASAGSTLRKAILARAATLRGKPYVIHLHGGGYADFFGGLRRGPQQLVRRFFAGAAEVIVLGNYWRAFLGSALGVPAQRNHVVRNGVRSPGQRRDGDKTDRYFVFVGSLTTEKGVDVLLDALDSLDGDPHWAGWRCVLIGPTPDQTLLRRIETTNARRPGLIEITGPLFGAEKDALLREASIFVLPSRIEGLPIAMVEGMAAGLACVCTRVGSVEEVLLDGHNGLAVDPGDSAALTRALRRLIGDPGYREALGAAALETWKREFTPADSLAALATVWDRALDGAR